MKIGVVGAGTIGQLRAQSIRSNPATELVGVVDPVAANAERAVAGSPARAFADLRQLLDVPGLEAVIVSSPLPAHEEQVLAAFAAGKHVLCEKPLGNTVEGAWRMVEAARAAKKVLATGFNHRYYPSMKFLKQAVVQGRIGNLDHVRVFGGHDGLHNFRADWQYKAPASGGGAMMDVGIHMTDLARYVAGTITEVYGVSSNKVLKVPGSEDNAVAVFKTESGVPIFYQATWTEWKGYRFYVEAYGDLGMVRGYYAPMQNLLITSEQTGGPRKKERKFYPEIMLREKFKSWTSTALLSFEEELADFVGLVGGKAGSIADGFDGFRAVEIANAVAQSTRDGKPVTLRQRPA